MPPSSPSLGVQPCAPGTDSVTLTPLPRWALPGPQGQSLKCPRSPSARAEGSLNVAGRSCPSCPAPGLPRAPWGAWQGAQPSWGCWWGQWVLWGRACRSAPRGPAVPHCGADRAMSAVPGNCPLCCLPLAPCQLCRGQGDDNPQPCTSHHPQINTHTPPPLQQGWGQAGHPCSLGQEPCPAQPGHTQDWQEREGRDVLGRG